MVRARSRQLATLVVAAAVAVALTGCSTGAVTAAGTPSSGTAAAADVPYTGPEVGFPASYATPVKVDGQSFKVGYLNPFDGYSVLHAEQEAAQAATEKLGGTLIAKDANLDPQLQVTQFDELLTQGVDAIVGYPLNPESWSNSIKKANAAGVPVIVLATPWDFSQPTLDGVTSAVGVAYDQTAYELAKAVAERKPGASFAVLNIGLPIPSLQYIGDRQEYWAKQFGLNYLGRVEASSDTPAAGAAAASELLAKYPNVDAIFAYSEPSAIASANLAKGKIVAEAGGGSATDAASVKNGGITFSYFQDIEAIGTQPIYGAYNFLTKQGGELPAQINIVSGKVVDQSSIGDEPGV